MYRYILALIFIWLNQGFITGQITTLTSPLFPSPKYTSSVSHTPDGFTWLGNNKGLWRYDGHRVIRIPIKEKDNSINHDQQIQTEVFQDQNNDLWFTSYKALHKLVPNTGSITTTQIKMNGVPVTEDYRAFYINRDKNEIWLRAGAFLWAYHTDSGQSRLLGGPTIGNSFTVVEDLFPGQFSILGAPWVLGKGLEVFSDIKGNKQSFTKRFIPLPFKVVSTSVSKDNVIFLASLKGPHRLTISQDTFSETPLFPSMTPFTCEGLTLSPSGEVVYFSHKGKGIGVLKDGDTEPIYITPLSGLSSNHPRELRLGPQGRLWASQYATGVDIIDVEPQLFKKDTNSKGLLLAHLQTSSSSSYFVGNDGNKYNFSDSGELNQVSLNQHVANIKGLNRPKVYSLGKDILIQTDHQILLQKQGEVLWKTGETSNNPFRGAYQGWNQIPLLLTSEGIMQIQENDSLTLSKRPEFKVQSTASFSAILPISDSLFALPYNGEAVWLVAVKPNGFQIIDKLPLSSDVFSLIRLTNPDKFWVGSSNGLYSITKGKTKLEFSGTPTMPDVQINAITKGPGNTLWLGTDKGLFLFNIPQCTYLYFSTEDGLPDNYFLRELVLETDENTFYMYTAKGLVKLPQRIPKKWNKPAEDSSNYVQPPPHYISPFIYDLSVNNQPYQGTIKAEYLTKITLPHQENTIGFRIGAAGIIPEGLTSVEFRLKGYEETFLQVETGSHQRYPNLPSGKYVLELKAIDAHGNEVAEKAIRIEILTPFTQTITFFLICVTFGSLLIVTTYLLLLNQTIKKQTRLRENQARITAERERIASELHDDLGGDLASMAFIIDGHNSLKELGVDAELDVSRLGQLANGAIKHMREMIWVLDDEQATLSTLAKQLLANAREMAAIGDLSLQADIPETLPELPLSSIQKKNILLMAKETMQNIRKHARASAFNLRLAVEQAGEQSYLLLVITDNGQGMKATQQGETDKPLNHGHGLKNLHKRAEEINATLSFTSSIPRGTKVTLRCPIAQQPKAPIK